MHLLSHYGITDRIIIRNPSPSALYSYAIKYEESAEITNVGALSLKSGEKTGRSPKDKRIIEHESSVNDVWWGDINIKMDDHTFVINKQRAIDYFNTRTRVYVIDGYAGWDPDTQLKIRVICTRAYHALFMHNMLIRPTAEQLKTFGEPDFIIYNAGQFPANIHTTHMESRTSVDFSFERKEVIILGTEYAGEMKKGVFTIMNYLMPKQDILSMHCSANESMDGDLALFFGLSGTGKTTLSADKSRRLIGDDEHCWNDQGVFNIEGGCYAKVIDLTAEKEPEIFQAIKFGTVLENVLIDPDTGEADYTSKQFTENTRASYPLEYIDNVKLPAVGGHPKNIIFLTCDAYGVLPPVSRLTPEQAMYHFISGYTAKMAGTEMGVKEPQATFSACFGAAFLVWHPVKYAELLAQKIREHDAKVWLVNTGWIRGAYGVGERISLKNTRSIINAIHNGTLAEAEYQTESIFGLSIPQSCPEVPSDILNPAAVWSSADAYEAKAKLLAGKFLDNFKQFESQCSPEILSAAPKA
ncbi:MAG TPA: phosphoenolpyruvate carboxykinase (ATP) [Cytophagales bacterium]|nr:phosphoenolpyruvate carboxykinase (ATP) [Cytophagales bacterium]HAA22403.1 phosphoenolpyruvate carboxykinase (ATP) [Cytophagales bacterium]HAP65121.1 phosphoenolpyruvate carboxykinase (ATP) [Cytophagales bacterium]